MPDFCSGRKYKRQSKWPYANGVTMENHVRDWRPVMLEHDALIVVH